MSIALLAKMSNSQTADLFPCSLEEGFRDDSDEELEPHVQAR